MTRSRIVITGAIAAAALALGAAPASAGSLGGFSGAGQVTTSSDGAHVYVATRGTTVAFQRDAETGAVTPLASYRGGGTHVELAPDGRHVYVLGAQSGQPQAINVFARDAATGALTPAGTWGAPTGAVTEIEFRDDRLAYVTDTRGSALFAVARDPESGALTLRRELRSGQDGVDLPSPAGMAVASGWLYVSTHGNAIRTFSLAGDGTPTYAPDPDCECSGDADLALVPGASRLLAGARSLFDIDPSTGRLSARPGTVSRGGGGTRVDGQVALSADGSDVYALDYYNARLLHLRHGPDGLALRREYLDGHDGEGMSWATGIALSPDGRHLYLAANDAAPQRYGSNLSVFRREAGSGELSFVQMFGGPNYRDPAETGDHATVTINGGAEYTNDPDVVLTVADVGTDTQRLEISNDGGFQKLETRFVAPGGTYPWRLASSGPEMLPKTVYVRLASSHPYERVGPISDSIVLDERRPAIVSARIKRSGKLGLRATDTLSGVSHVQVTRDPKRPGKWRRYAKTLSVPKGRGKLRVRVRDRASNESKWRTVR